MFLRSNRRFKDGKEHRYFSVVENRRLRSGKVIQRRVLYSGEINDSQQAGWRKTLEVFDEAERHCTTLSLFPEDRALPNVLPLYPGERHWEILSGLLPAAQARGALVLDAHLAALALEHGALLATTDRDFARFPGLRWQNPLEAAAS